MGFCVIYHIVYWMDIARMFSTLFYSLGIQFLKTNEIILNINLYMNKTWSYYMVFTYVSICQFESFCCPLWAFSMTYSKYASCEISGKATKQKTNSLRALVFVQYFIITYFTKDPIWSEKMRLPSKIFWLNDVYLISIGCKSNIATTCLNIF